MEGGHPRGKFILVFGPTGSGKSVLVTYTKEKYPEIDFVTSYTTRARRPGHENAEYRFGSVEEFEQLRQQNGFIEWAKFGDNFYATPKKEVEDGLAAGKLLFKEMELQGVLQTRDLISPEELVIIYVDAGSWEDLERRVRSRAPITDDELAKRKERFEEEVSYKHIANYVVENLDGKLDEAKASLSQIIESVTESIRK